MLGLALTNEISSQPNSTYQLTQAVLLQEHALNNAQQQIQAMQQHMQSMQQEIGQLQNKKKGFFGSLFGGNQPPTQPHYQQQSAPIGGNQGSNYGYSQNQGYHNYQQSNQGFAPKQQTMGGGSSFLRSAATTAVGVAGGMFLFQGINSMFSGGGAESASAAAADPGIMDTSNFGSDPTMLNDGFGGDSSFMGGDGGADLGGSGFDSSNFGGGFDSNDFGGGDFF